jgi:predicted Zn-dependent protease
MKNISRREVLLELFVLSGALVAGNCAINPATGKREFMLVSEQDEISMGRKAHPQIIKSYGVYNNPEIQNFVNTVGQNIVKITPRSKLNFTFTVLESPVVNAFAVPGGYVYINRGILAYFNDEAQFAGVLAHEIGHVVARHSAEQISKEKLTNLGLGIGSILSPTVEQFSDILSLGSSLLFLKFSRDDERQADKLGVDYSTAAGFDARRMSDFFHTFQRLAPKGSQALPAWESTHPDPGDRVAATEKEALGIQKKHPDQKYLVKRNDYLNLVNGLVYGEDPREGYVKNGMFYHPVMKFKFPVPAGWGASNQPDQVNLAPKDQKAFIIFMVQDGAEPRDAALKFAEGNQITVEQTVSVTVHGLSGVRTTGKMTSQSQLSIISYFIRMDNKIVEFHCASAPADTDTYVKIFDQVAAGFDRLNDPAFINVSPAKIELRSVTATKTLKNAFNEFGIPEEKLNELAIINGSALEDSMEAGTLIKIIS